MAEAVAMVEAAAMVEAVATEDVAVDAATEDVAAVVATTMAHNNVNHATTVTATPVSVPMSNKVSATTP